MRPSLSGKGRVGVVFCKYRKNTPLNRGIFPLTATCIWSTFVQLHLPGLLFVIVFLKTKRTS